LSCRIKYRFDNHAPTALEVVPAQNFEQVQSFSPVKKAFGSICAPVKVLFLEEVPGCTKHFGPSGYDFFGTLDRFKWGFSAADPVHRELLLGV
jgi:hypothetical protein